ncbi:pyridoxamine 5'-phosphate oxidase [Asanoa ishikariensis]|uniref:Nitroimidazol reductase NimA, pyridoxamine 5'-phosphate oxidase superfamily n=1 Tax=Asanoa ishikariensis TaxID=137265 RepID=A0A1H3UIU2_9ACTN|nr:pyridoxamine 5'-phosphate oxidase family protein [Asanoa ishikariensis]GIF63383.1 pyridoxamine 5'-phosphate oxidase [Asanoa ishikariensis]SDZ62412.1 Nitroimidazol reductase NimA, pyridoxamine 5'-phosphate oxidase superfamily [Asanoa ishikariensis]
MDAIPAGPGADRNLAELSRTECLRLIATGSVGRVVFTEGALPAAHPVNYLLDGEEVVFRTGGGGKLAAATLRNIVAFQVDDIRAGARTGWSVLGVGEAYEVVDALRLGSLAPRMPEPWSESAVDGHLIAIPLHRLTGRVTRGR